MILVTGGTGTLGRQVVARLRDTSQNEIRVLSRRHHDDADGVRFVTGDLAAGEGLKAAVDGADVIVYCAGSRKGDAEAARNLVTAIQPRTPHLVYTSVVGADRVSSFVYFRAKREAERIVADSGLPWTTLRATQFYDLIFKGAAQLAKLPVAPVPAGFLTQPVDSAEVAARLVELALGGHAGLVPDMGGPRSYSFAELIRSYLQASGRRRPLLPVWLPGLKEVRAGALLPSGPGADIGKKTWEQFLAERLTRT